jgi:hypothetical protein
MRCRSAESISLIVANLPVLRLLLQDDIIPCSIVCLASRSFISCACERPRRHRAAEQRDELTSSQLVELHSALEARPDGRILARMRTVDETKPYIWIEPTRPPADSSREFGDTAAIHLVVPNVSRVDVPMTRTERNAVAFDYFCKKFKDGINV